MAESDKGKNVCVKAMDKISDLPRESGGYVLIYKRGHRNASRIRNAGTLGAGWCEVVKD
jgi:hypothetical protein